jgi:uncharacterized protein (TIGR02246 family)
MPLLLVLALMPIDLAHAANMQGQPTKPSDIAPNIDAANKAWLEAYAKGDASALAALYTDTATILPAGADMVTGHDAIVKFMQATIASGLKITKLTTIAIDHQGSVAREIGRFAGSAPGPDKQMVPIEGKYVVYWKKVKGVWKLDTDTWNMNK